MPTITAQGRYWILTIPHANYLPYLPPGVVHIAGQLERGGGETGYLHWQLVATFPNKVRLGGVRNIFGPHHAELTRSDAARKYVWKEDTCVAGTKFELGELPVRRGNSEDISRVVESAKAGKFHDIPADFLLRYYSNIRRIASDFGGCPSMQRECKVYWGRSGTGKSRRAWEEAGDGAYCKDPNTKFWDGYQGQDAVVMDEYRGTISISHILRWLDRYPVRVEIKGSSTPLLAKTIWITSNLDPRKWYPDLDEDTLEALMRRLNIEHFL